MAVAFHRDATAVAKVLSNLRDTQRVCIGSVVFDSTELSLRVTFSDGSTLVAIFFDISGYPRNVEGALVLELSSRPHHINGLPKEAVPLVESSIERGPVTQPLALAFHKLASAGHPFWAPLATAAQAIRETKILGDNFTKLDASRATRDDRKEGINEIDELDTIPGLRLATVPTDVIDADVQVLKHFGYDVTVIPSAGAAELAVSLRVAELELNDQAKTSWGLTMGTRIEVRLLFENRYIRPNAWHHPRSVRFRVRLLRERTGEDSGRPPAVVPFLLGTSLQSILESHFCAMTKIFISGKFGWAGALVAVLDATRLIYRINQDHQSLQADQTEKIMCRDALDRVDKEMDEEEAAKGNLPLLAVRWVRREILTAHRKCIECRKLLCFGLNENVMLSTCFNDTCLFQNAEMGVNDSKLQQELLLNPLVVDLLISLTLCSLSTRCGKRLLDPGPSPAISVGVEVGIPALEVDPSITLLRSKLPALTPRSYELLASVIASIPSVLSLHLAASAGRSIRDFLREQGAHPLAYRLLYWIVASNRTQLSLVTKAENKILVPREFRGPRTRDRNQRRTGLETVLPGYWQFILESGSPEKEAAFSLLAQEYGTGYAFHGSALMSWHSILRHGLDFKETLHGRAHGDGVYLSAVSRTSLRYSAGARAIWRNSLLKPTSCLAVVEYANTNDPQVIDRSGTSIIVSEPSHVVVRYLLVGGKDARQVCFELEEVNSSQQPGLASFRRLLPDDNYWSCSKNSVENVVIKPLNPNSNNEPSSPKLNCGYTKSGAFKTADGFYIPPRPRIMHFTGASPRRKRAGLLSSPDHNIAGEEERMEQKVLPCVREREVSCSAEGAGKKK